MGRTSNPLASLGRPSSARSDASRAPWLVLAAVLVASLAGQAQAQRRPQFTPGAAGAGDHYFPTAGNGGYEVKTYDLDLTYDPGTRRLVGEARLAARATQNLSRFDLDLDGLTVDAVRVEDRAAAWRRNGGELVVTPAEGLRDGALFVVAVRYHGVPTTLPDFGGSGFVPTADGALVVGEPRVAITWFPANDHPRDAATFSVRINLPAGLQAISNRRLVSQRTRAGWTTWQWETREPMANYLAFLAIWHYVLAESRDGGRFTLNAIEQSLLAQTFTPPDGTAFALSGQADSALKRLTRSITVPPAGASLTFAVNRSTEEGWDYFFVEARVAGTDGWTTLPEAGGRATQDSEYCGLIFTHPFLDYYLTFDWSIYTCAPSGTSGEWWAATGVSHGWERWGETCRGTPARPSRSCSPPRATRSCSWTAWRWTPSRSPPASARPPSSAVTPAGGRAPACPRRAR